MGHIRYTATVAVAVVLALTPPAGCDAATYYISSSTGNDGWDGLTEGTAFASVGKVNSLVLQPGDTVLFRCGDLWRAEPLSVTATGSPTQPVSFGSYPPGCVNQPLLTGSRPVFGWTPYSGSIYVADLGGGANAGLFPLGINQLFQAGQRLPFGRWPNLPGPDGGYSWVDGYSSAQLTDHQLPPVSWAGAIIRIKTERWLLVNREVLSSSGPTLTLNESLSCRGGCDGWGYFLQNHLATVDQDGEWYFDASTNRVYLYSAESPPTEIEGSVILDTVTGHHGGVMIGKGAEYVTLENLEISRWFDHGVSGAGSMSQDVYHHITFRNNTIADVDSSGVRLSTWVWSASNGRDGLRGGRSMVFDGNKIEGANHFGITGYFSQSTFDDNDIRNIGLIANLGKSGMGCGVTGASCTENGDGLRIRKYLVEDSGHNNAVRYNRIRRTGYNGLDVFGPDTTVEFNLFEEPCYSKGDCGGVRTFGNDSLVNTEVHDILLRSNIVVDSIGNVDGVKSAYRELFGMGLYIDHFSRDVTTVDNTVINATITGILYQNSTGSITGNTVYNAASGSMYSGHIGLAYGTTVISAMTGNVLYGLDENAWTLALDGGQLLTSDQNYFFHPYVEKQITTDLWAGRKTFSEWQTWSGMDGSSTDNWFTLSSGDSPLSRPFYNATASTTAVSLGTRTYLDLDQNPVDSPLVLPPYSSVILVDNGPRELIFADGFETGGTGEWGP